MFLLFAGLTPAAFAHAEVKQSAADSFVVTFSAPVTATATKTYADLAQVQRWWSDEHTWSGKASNLSLKAEAGGCFCERWKDGSAEHGRVIMALPGKLLRVDSALGPLQEFALKGILNFWIRSGEDGATQLTLEYRVNGAGASGLEQFAPKVDEMLGAQFERLVRFIDSGNPEPPPVATAPAPLAAPQSADTRAALLDAWAREAAGEQAHAQDGKRGAPKSAKPKPPKKP